MKEGLKRVDSGKLKMDSFKEGYKKTELGWIPEEWEPSNLIDIAEINPKKEVFDSEKEVSFIAMEHVSNSGRVLNMETRNYNDVFKGYTAFKDNDVLLAKITPCFENGKKAIVKDLKNGYGFGSTEFHVLRSKNERSIPEFLYYYVSTNKFRQQAELNMTGSAGQRRVPTTFLNDNRLVVPPLKEQQKISEILSTVDSQIDDTDKLIEKTRELKKGLMQRLLTKGIGHREFKMTEVGEIPVEWDVFMLNEVVEINPKKELLNDMQQVTFIPMEGVSNEGRVIKSHIRKYKEVSKGYTAFKDNDVLLAKITPCFENGKKALVKNLKNGVGFGSTEFHVLRCIENKVMPKFIYYYISTHRFRQLAELNMTGSAGQKRVPTTFLNENKLLIPSLEEQEKISNILSSVDTQIDEYENNKAKLEELKKALMQQLLTGKIRVKV